MMKLDKWFSELEKLAKEKDLLWLIGDKEACEDFYEFGDSPAEALDEIIDDAQR